MPVLKLTKTSIDRLPKPTKATLYFDAELTGFFVRVQPSGTKAYGVAYRAGSGRGAAKKTVTICPVGKLTPDQAREHAKLVLADAVKGQDPAAAKAAKRREMTVAALVELYSEEGLVRQRGQRMGEPMKERTARYTLNRLKHHVVPLLGSRKVSQVGPGDIERFVRAVEAGETAKDEKIAPRKRVIVKGGDGAARKVFRDLSAMCSFAVRRGIMSANPCTTAAVRKVDNERDRYLTMDELAKLWAALESLAAEGANPKAINIIKLWCVTGCRRSEIEALKWSEVDFRGGLLRLEETKEGKSVRPLGAEAVAILEAVPPTEGSSYVFPADRGERWFQGAYSAFEKARKRAGLDGSQVVAHTLRHTVGSISAGDGSLLLTGAVLGHKNPRSTGRYAHVQRNPAKGAADRVSERITAALRRGKSPSNLDVAKPEDPVVEE